VSPDPRSPRAIVSHLKKIRDGLDGCIAELDDLRDREYFVYHRYTEFMRKRGGEETPSAPDPAEREAGA
jgi:hypothetical protein